MLKKLILMALIVFVPVQSWAITSMGLQLEQSANQHSQSLLSSTVHACLQNVEQQSEHEHVQNSIDDSSCSSCTLCMAIGLIQILTQLGFGDHLHQAPSTADKTLISANSSRLNKPPIQ